MGNIINLSVYTHDQGTFAFEYCHPAQDISLSHYVVIREKLVLHCAYRTSEF